MRADGRQAAQFADLIRVHLRGQRFLDREKELKLLEEGITRYDLSLAEASAVLRTATEDASVVGQTELDASTLQLLRTMADRRGRVGQPEFDKVAAFYRGRAGAALPAEDARGRVKRIMEEHDIEPRRSGRILRTRRWYRAIES